MTIRYTKDHEYIDYEGEFGTIGITEYAQQQLGDVVFVELPALNKSLTQGESFAVIESVKAASEVYAPVSGTIEAVNETLAAQPHLVNEQPLTGGWLARFRLTQPEELEALMDTAGYQHYLATLDAH